MRLLTLTLAAIALFGSVAAAEIHAPRIGMVRQLDGKIRPVYGVTANLICGQPLDLQSATVASFSDQAGLVLAGNRLVLQTVGGTVLGAVQTSEPHPLLGIESSPETAAAWLPASRKLLIWNGQFLVDAKVDIQSLPGKPAGIRRLDKNSVEFLLDAGNGNAARAVVSMRTGAILEMTALPGISEPAFASNSSLVGQDDHQLVLQLNDGSRRRLPISGSDLVLEKASSSWFAVTSKAAGRQWLVHIDKAGVDASELPQGLDAPAAARIEASR